MSKIIIHYRESDKEWAGWIQAVISDAGYESSMLCWSFEDGPTFMGKLERYWKDHKTYVIPVLSPHYLAAVHSRQDWVLAVKQSSNPLLSVRVKKCIVDSQLFARLGKYVDLATVNQDNGRYLLLEELRKVIGPPDKRQQMQAQGKGKALARNIFHVPVPRMENYAARESLLQSVHQGLVQQQLAVIASDDGGLGGVGRRQLAVELAHARADDYQVIWWMRADHPCSLIYDYARLAQELGLPEAKHASTSSTVKAVNHWLRNNAGWLLIFDRLRKQSYLPRFLPAQHRGQALISTSAAAWPTPQHRIVLGEMDRQQSIVLITRETGQLDEGAAAAVAARLRDFPITLRLASRYIVAAKLRLTDYFDRFDAAAKNLGPEIVPQERRFGPAFIAFHLIAGGLREVAPEALDLLRLCAHFAPDDIRLSDLTTGQKHLCASLQTLMSDQPALNNAVGTLARFGLIDFERERGLITIHPVVQRLTQEWTLRMPQQSAGRSSIFRMKATDILTPETWRTQAFNLVSNAFPEDCAGEHTWPECTRLMSHAFAVIQQCQNDVQLYHSLADLYGRTGRYLHMRGLHAEAAQVLNLAVQFSSKAQHPDPRRLAFLNKALGSALWAVGKLQDARKHLENALELDKQIYKEIHEVVSKDFTLLGTLLEEMDELFLARQQYEAALAIDLKLTDNQQGLLARDYGNLGLIEQKIGNCSQAWRHYERALEISKEVHGEKHESISTLLKNMGGLMRELGDLPRAKDYIKRAIEMDKLIYGSGHPELSRAYSNYGMVLQELGELEEAIVYYEQALAVDRAIYGDSHRKVAIRLNNIASILQTKGDLKTAQSYYTKAHTILKRVFGQDHPLVVLTRRNLDQVEAWLLSNQAAPPPAPTFGFSTPSPDYSSDKQLDSDGAAAALP